VTVKDLAILFDYGYWSNTRLFDVVSRLPVDEFTRPVAGSYGSIRNTLVHMLSAEAGWLDRCGGPPRGPKLNPDDFPTLASVTERWTLVERQMRDFLGTLGDDDLDRRVEFVIAPGAAPHVMSIGEMLHHSAIHNVHHRGQIALLLRMLGHVPGNFDVLFYYGEKAAASSP
jgi:uncharacterized damage-inducible protein DinB